MNHIVYCFQIRIPTRRFRAHWKVVSRNIERVISKIGIISTSKGFLSYIRQFHGCNWAHLKQLEAHFECNLSSGWGKKEISAPLLAEKYLSVVPNGRKYISFANSNLEYFACVEISYLLVGQGWYRGPNSRTFKILLTLPHQPPPSILTSPSCSPPPN